MEHGRSLPESLHRFRQRLRNARANDIRLVGSPCLQGAIPQAVAGLYRSGSAEVPPRVSGRETTESSLPEPRRCRRPRVHSQGNHRLRALIRRRSARFGFPSVGSLQSGRITISINWAAISGYTHRQDLQRFPCRGRTGLPSALPVLQPESRDTRLPSCSLEPVCTCTGVLPASVLILGSSGSGFIATLWPPRGQRPSRPVG